MKNLIGVIYFLEFLFTTIRLIWVDLSCLFPKTFCDLLISGFFINSEEFVKIFFGFGLVGHLLGVSDVGIDIFIAGINLFDLVVVINCLVVLFFVFIYCGSSEVWLGVLFVVFDGFFAVLKCFILLAHFDEGLGSVGKEDGFKVTIVFA